MDVKCTYLNDNLGEEMYMKLPPDENRQTQLCKLSKSIYGLKQSGRAWFRKINDTMINLNFKNIISDTSLYFNEKL